MGKSAKRSFQPALIRPNQLRHQQGMGVNQAQPAQAPAVDGRHMLLSLSSSLSLCPPFHLFCPSLPLSLSSLSSLLYCLFSFLLPSPLLSPLLSSLLNSTLLSSPLSSPLYSP